MLQYLYITTTDNPFQYRRFYYGTRSLDVVVAPYILSKEI